MIYIIEEAGTLLELSDSMPREAEGMRHNSEEPGLRHTLGVEGNPGKEEAYIPMEVAVSMAADMLRASTLQAASMLQVVARRWREGCLSHLEVVDGGSLAEEEDGQLFVVHDSDVYCDDVHTRSEDSSKPQDTHTIRNSRLAQVQRR